MKRFVDALVDAGASGLIVPVMPFDEAGTTFEACGERGLALVPLIAPTTSDARLSQIGERARGFLYAVSLTGTTGERATLDRRLPEIISRAASHTGVPVAAGFGISTPAHALAAAAAGADGVIIGSRLVRAADQADDPARTVAVAVREFADALGPGARTLRPSAVIG
jgi:tryptophan synthase alpha chain